MKFNAAVTSDQVRDHYEGLSFGRFCYSDTRAGYYPLIDEFLSGVGPDDRLCDIGCGAGFWLDEFVRRGIREEQLLGIDLAPSNVCQVVERGHRAVCGDVTSLDIPDGSFNRTFCSGVIHHTPDPSRALLELARVTAPGGYIYLAVYNKWHPYFWVVHKATAPIRALHQRGWQMVSRISYGAWCAVVQPVSRVVLGRWLDARTCRALYMDQVLTPYAHLATRRALERECATAGLHVLDTRYALGALMLIALVKVDRAAPAASRT